MITYQIENDLSAAEFIAVLQNSTLAERRPVHDAARISRMLQHANLIVTARAEGQLVGVSRALSDFAFCTYLSDLAVDLKWKKEGIGKDFIRQTKSPRGPGKLILLASPAAEQYYPKIGMQHAPHCYFINTADEL